MSQSNVIRGFHDDTVAMYIDITFLNSISIGLFCTEYSRRGRSHLVDSHLVIDSLSYDKTTISVDKTCWIQWKLMKCWLFRGSEINVWPAGVVPVNLIFGSSSRSRKTTRKQQQTTLFLCSSNSTTGVSLINSSLYRINKLLNKTPEWMS